MIPPEILILAWGHSLCVHVHKIDSVIYTHVHCMYVHYKKTTVQKKVLIYYDYTDLIAMRKGTI